jgi:hypothetical protein
MERRKQQDSNNDQTHTQKSDQNSPTIHKNLREKYREIMARVSQLSPMQRGAERCEGEASIKLRCVWEN